MTKNKKVKVLQLHPDYNIRSIDVSDLGEQIFKALPTDQYETINGFFHGEPSKDDPISIADKSIYFKFTKKQVKGLRLSALMRLYRFLKKNAIDVVICNRYKPTNIMLTLSRFFPHVKFIAIVHGFGDYDRKYRRLHLKRNLRSNWQFVGVSEPVRQYLLNLNMGLTEGNVSFIDNAIDVIKAERMMLSREQARLKLGLAEDWIVAGTLGRLIPLKNHEGLIKAFAMISSKVPDAHIVILGDGREKTRLELLVSELGLGGRVHLLGFYANGLQYIKAFDFWVMPSFKEGLSLALLEAMSASIPLLTSDIDTIKPLTIKAGGTAVSPHDIETLSQELLRYFQMSNHQREELGQCVYEYVINSHSIDDYRKKYYSLISKKIV